MSDSIEVVEAARVDFGRVSECLARAFYEDPVAIFLFPKPRGRLQRLASLYRLVLTGMSTHGRVLTDPGIRGAAVWQAPSPPEPGVVGSLFGALMLGAVMRSASRRAAALNRAAASAHPGRPHWYLGILGTDPVHQGAGVASALMQPTLERCDAAGLPAYLESSKESNIPFYERHAFRVTGEVRVDGGPKLWSMLRN